MESILIRWHAKQEYSTAGQKPPRVSWPRAVRMTPPARYTGIPGTGGAKNIAQPIGTKTKVTKAREYEASLKFSQLRNTIVALPTPTLKTQRKPATQITLERTEVQFHSAIMRIWFMVTEVKGRRDSPSSRSLP